MLISCLSLAWLALLSRVIVDIFRCRDRSGWGATAWVVVAVLLPFLGVLAYIASHRDGMAERSNHASGVRSVKQKASNARLA
jgi:Phospholipase_D-nuclease N-terminal